MTKEELTKFFVAALDAQQKAHLMMVEAIEAQILVEREACARLVEADGLARGNEGLVLIKAAERIRARGEK
jgi:hypothetical protein